MAPLAVLLDAAATAVVRRSLPPDAPPLLRVSGAAALPRLLERRPVEGLVVGAAQFAPEALMRLRASWPALPVVVVLAPRADDGPLLRHWREAGAAALVVQGVDDAVAGAIVLRHALVAARWRALAAVARAARCETPLQRQVWRLLLARADAPPDATALAAASSLARATLSRQFASGASPNLKRASDAARVAFAAQLLANPAVTVPDAATLLGFAGPAHLRTTAQRIAGVPASALAGLGAAGVLSAFVRGRARSRRAEG